MSSSDARREMLARIRAAVPDGMADAVPREYRTAGEPIAGPATSGRASPRRSLFGDANDLPSRLAERITEYAATVQRCGPGQLPTLVGQAVARRGAGRIVVPDGLDPAWLVGLPETATVVVDEPPLSAAALDTTAGVITTCAVAIAETGTVVLDAGPGQGRRALTLLPDFHLVIVPPERIVAGVPEAIAVLDPHHPLTWISGPSATSDIELNRVEGVHGPRDLEVIVLSPDM